VTSPKSPERSTAMRSTELNDRTISDAVSGFPKGWRLLKCSDIRPHGQRLADWVSLERVRGHGGVYAFLVPKRLLGETLSQALHAKGGNVLLHYRVGSLKALLDGKVCLYVGRTFDLLTRLQQHLRPSTHRSGAQVQTGLVRSGVCKSRPEAVNWLFDTATIVYREMTGDSEVANRDIVEVSLCGKHRPPFNIKAEH